MQTAGTAGPTGNLGALGVLAVNHPKSCSEAVMRFDDVVKSLGLESAHELWRADFDRSAEGFGPDCLVVTRPDEWEKRLSFFNLLPEPAEALRLARSQVAQNLAMQRLLWHIYHRYFIADFLFDFVAATDNDPLLPPQTREGGALIDALMCIEALPTRSSNHHPPGVAIRI